MITSSSRSLLVLFSMEGTKLLLRGYCSSTAVVWCSHCERRDQETIRALFFPPQRCLTYFGDVSGTKSSLVGLVESYQTAARCLLGCEAVGV